MKFETTTGEHSTTLDLNLEIKEFSIGGNADTFEFSYVNGRYLLRLGTKLYKIDNVTHDGSLVEFSMNGVRYSVDVKDEQDLLLDRLGFKTNSSSAEGILKAPMPGKILDIMVNEGDEVDRDQPLVILEAMKMENELKAPVGGIISSIMAESGQSIEKNTAILEIESIG